MCVRTKPFYVNLLPMWYFETKVKSKNVGPSQERVAAPYRPTPNYTLCACSSASACPSCPPTDRDMMFKLRNLSLIAAQRALRSREKHK